MDTNAARVERSIAPPETKPYLDETLVPGYMVPTENRPRRDRRGGAHRVSRRSRPRRELFSEEEWARKMRTSQARIAWLAKQMTPSQRDEEERVASMRVCKTGATWPPGGARSLGAPRADDDQPTTTASPQPSDTTRFSWSNLRAIDFNAYEIGETYELGSTIEQVRAESASSRAPSASRHFSVTEMRWPSQHGMLAPGMSCSCSVRFKPDSLADYEDSLVLSEVMKFELDLAARHPQAHPRRRHRRRPRPRGQRRGIPSAVQERRRPGSIPRGGRRVGPSAPPLSSEPRRGARTRRIARGRPDAVRRLAPFRVGPGVMDLAPMQ